MAESFILRYSIWFTTLTITTFRCTEFRYYFNVQLTYMFYDELITLRKASLPPHTFSFILCNVMLKSFHIKQFYPTTFPVFHFILRNWWIYPEIRRGTTIYYRNKWKIKEKSQKRLNLGLSRNMDRSVGK